MEKLEKQGSVQLEMLNKYATDLNPMAKEVTHPSLPNICLGHGRLIAGASNRGEYEERLTNLIDEVKLSEGSIGFFIDEVQILIGAGTGGQALDAANIMKPALARGELRVN
ncbi:hypothetical protein Pint_35488 [Pistacia integerrima]|uniref:Uncharacterized protein n=1 Tax=Pistacia integerrima TaxID=434235 RepID=A0ACC0Y2S8_9ROSI|nr:hypothetical protein Pint_35488 [Pistacia integerrima]